MAEKRISRTQVESTICNVVTRRTRIDTSLPDSYQDTPVRIYIRRLIARSIKYGETHAEQPWIVIPPSGQWSEMYSPTQIRTILNRIDIWSKDSSSEQTRRRSTN